MGIFGLSSLDAILLIVFAALYYKGGDFVRAATLFETVTQLDPTDTSGGTLSINSP